MRRVEYKYIDYDTKLKSRVQYSGSGLFHQFSIESKEIGVGSLHCPIAIIELRNGQIKTVPADSIKFTSEQEGAQFRAKGEA